MSDLVLLKTYPSKDEADRLRAVLSEHGIEGVVAIDNSAKTRADADRPVNGGTFDVMIPAVDATKAVSLLTPLGLRTPLAEPNLAGDRSAEEVERLTVTIADLDDRYKRAYAELENMRRRHERVRQELVRFALEDFLKDMIPVLDSLEKALPAEESAYLTADGVDRCRPIFAGMLQVKRQLIDACKKHGLKEITAVGAPFDPQVHHAIKQIDSGAVPAETVGEEYARGYLLNGRVLRPAMVSVLMPKPKETEERKLPPARSEISPTVH